MTRNKKRFVNDRHRGAGSVWVPALKRSSFVGAGRSDVNDRHSAISAYLASFSMFSGSFFSGLKQIAILTCIAGIALGVAAAADQRIAFERGEAVYITNVDASIIRKVADGIFPAISPNAKS